MPSSRDTFSPKWKERLFPETGDVIRFDEGYSFDEGYYWDQVLGYSWNERTFRDDPTHTFKTTRPWRR